MKEGWKKVKLSEIATNMFRGSGIKRDQVKKEGFPCVRYGEIYTTYNISFEKCVSYTTEADITSPKYFEKGDILFAITGESVEEIGKSIAYLGDEKCLLGGDIAVMQHTQNPKYLSYALSSPNAIKQKGLGKTKLKVVHTNIPSLKEIEIPLPPLPEQQRIVEYLDSTFAEIDALKAKAAEEVANAKAMFDAALREEMTPKEGWEEKTLGEICSKIGSGATPKGGKNVYIETGVSIVRSLNVHKGYFKHEELAHITDDAADALKSVTLESGDVLFNITGASIARCCIVPDSVLPARVNQHVSILRIKDYVSPKYLMLALNSGYHQDILLAIGEAGSTRQALTKNDLETHKIFFPKSYSTQQAIVTRLDTLRALVTSLEQKYTKIATECDALKQAILKQVFE